MKLCFSGFERQAHLDVVVEANVKYCILDYSCELHRNPRLINQFDFIIARLSMKKVWSQHKYLWDKNSKRRKAKENEGTLDRLKDRFFVKLKTLLDDYLSWAKSYSQIKVIAFPEIDIDFDYDSIWVQNGCFKLAMPTAKNIDEVKVYLEGYCFVGVSKEIEAEELKGLIFSDIVKYREGGSKLHGWGRSSKDDIASGVFYSTDTSIWMGGSKYGNTYHYVGNMKMVTHSSKRGKGKDVRSRFSTECLKYGVDQNAFLNDDQHHVDLWNISQWKRYSEDAEYVGGYWENRKVNMENKSIVKAESKALDQVFGSKALANKTVLGASLRLCNTCFLSPNCPVYLPDSECNLSKDPKVGDPQDIQSLINKVIQIQGERVLFASYAEKIQNNGINPEVSSEIETLMQVMKDAKQVLAPVENDEIMIKAKGSGVISRLFGGYGRSGGGGSRPSQSEKIIDVSPLEEKDE